MEDNNIANVEETAEINEIDNKPIEQSTEQNTVEPTETDNQTEEQQASPEEPIKEITSEMTSEQFLQYRDALRALSKGHNAFEDGEIRALIKQSILKGETPDLKGIVADVKSRLTPKVETPTETKHTPIEADNTQTNKIAELEAENALLKVGIKPERLEAAKKLFIAEGFTSNKAKEFAEKYPEWKAGENNSGVTFKRMPPLGEGTAPAPSDVVVMNDFEKKVYAARKKAGLD